MFFPYATNHKIHSGVQSLSLTKACEILAHGRTHPAIFNDDTITKGLKYYGVDKKEAHNYIHSTCVEITPSAASNVWVATPYTNMPQLLMDLFDREYDSFDELMNALYKSIDTKIKCDFEEKENLRKVRYEGAINPLLKSIIEAYMERGGFELQINVTDNQILKEAIKNPDQYQDLLVRIGGYSNYFVRLDPAMQQELILRTEHNA